MALIHELEYRGKRKDNNEWVHGGFYKHQLKTPSPIVPKGEKPEEIEYAYIIVVSGFSDWNMPKPLLAYEITFESIGIFFGYFDIKGNKIFTGDIVKLNDYHGQRIVEIKFYNGIFYYTGDGFSDEHIRNAKDIEIIGNIIENPELLEIKL